MVTMRSRAVRGMWAWLLAMGSTWSTGHAIAAEPSRMLVLPTSVGEHWECGIALPSTNGPDPTWAVLARRVDDLVTNAVEDAGMDPEMRLNISGGTPGQVDCLDDTALKDLAKQAPVISGRIAFRAGKLWLRLVVVQPGTPVMRVTVQPVLEKDLDVRVVVMVSELLAADESRSGGAKPVNAAVVQASDATQLAPKPRSQGRGVLALTSAAFGAGIGYSLQRASGSDDPRLTYPLIAIGTGIGIGASLIAAEEWDLSVGEAWYLNAGMLWPTTSGIILAHSYNRDRYIYGLAGASSGMFLAAVALNFSEISEGGALVAHSGGAMGLLLGGLVDMTYHGSTSNMPYRGMGYGAGIGVLLAGVAATQVQVSSSRVLFVDLSAGLGALTGAALGSPLLILDDSLMSVKRQRAWLGLVGAGAVVGGGIGWYLTRSWTVREHEGAGTARLWPYVAPAASPTGIESPRLMGVTAGVQGSF